MLIYRLQAWSLVTLRDGAWHLQLIKRLIHVEPTRGETNVQIPTITCVLPMAQAVYTGDEDGKVVSFVLYSLTFYIADIVFQYEWNCVQRHGVGPFNVWR